MDLKEQRERQERVKNSLQVGRSRIAVTGAVFAILFVIIAVRVIDLSLFSGDGPREPALVSTETNPVLETTRADIVDRNGVLLATTLPTDSIFIDSKAFLETGENPTLTARKLSRILPELSLAKAEEKLKSGKRFEYLVRNLTPNQKYQVNQLGIPGLHFQREERRTYPQGPLAAHILGYTDVDGRGIAGIEKSFNDVLLQTNKPLQLAMDVRIQSIFRKALQDSIDEFKALGAAGILMDIHTGEIIASVSLPDFDPNDPGGAIGEAAFNRATKGVYEMGSIFKLLNTAMALDTGIVDITDQFDARNPIKVGRFLINDFHAKKQIMTVPEVLVFSSNIGSAKIALEVGTKKQQEYLEKLGLLRAADVEIPEVGRPLVPARWRDVHTMTISYGHGIAVTPLQLTSAIATVANGGLLRPATLLKVKENEIIPSERVFKQETSDQMRELMRLVVTEGSGKKANSEFYRVGGKTGTADKQEGGRYNTRARISSFAGVFPIENPRYALLASIDEPVGNKSTFGYATAGWVAAPVAKKIVDRVGPLLGLSPSRVADVEYEPGNPLFIRVKDKKR